MDAIKFQDFQGRWGSIVPPLVHAVPWRLNLLPAHLHQLILD